MDDLLNEDMTFEVTAQGGRKGVWRVSLDTDVVTIAAVDGEESFRVPHGEAETTFELRNWLFTKSMLIVNIGKKKKVVFLLDRPQAETLKQWAGPPTIHGLKAALKRRFGWCVSIGLLFIITSLPWPANPEAGFEAVPFDPFSIFLGVALIAISMLAVNVAISIFLGASPWWIFSILVLILVAKSGFAEYRRFVTVSCEQNQPVR
jgi:hypothetical protein